MRLLRRVAGIEGAAVEHNKFCVSVHFRNCAPGAHEAVLGAVEVTLRAHAELHATRGRKVFEIRPQARGPIPPALSSLAPLPRPSGCTLDLNSRMHAHAPFYFPRFSTFPS